MELRRFSKEIIILKYAIDAKMFVYKLQQFSVCASLRCAIPEL